MSRKEYLKRKLLEHLIGPTGSILLHILIVYLAVHFIVFETREGTAEIEVTMMEVTEFDLDDLFEEFEPEFEPPEFDLDFEMPDVMDVEMDAPADLEDFSQDVADMDFAALDVMQVDSPLVMQGLFSGRSSEGRAALLRQHGGRWGAQTEQAVIRALQWLKNNQEADGSWSTNMSGSTDAQHRVAITGLGLLAFLAHGETPASREYGQTIEKAIRYLVDAQNEKGEFIDPSIRPHGAYVQAVATYALSEAYGLTRIPSLRDPMEKGVSVILDGQNADGLWGYGYLGLADEPINTSVSVWQMQAMKAAQIAGYSSPRFNEAIERGLERMLLRQAEDGEWFYRGVERVQEARRPDHGLTAAAVLTLQLFEHGNSRQARDGIAVLRNARIEWNRPEQWPMSRWYYVTQVKFQQGNRDEWRRWNDQFAPQFIHNQRDDGRFVSPAVRGADIPFGFEDRFGDAFSTAMSALTLQVYYRILPTFGRVEQPPEEEETTTSDVIIQII